MGMRIGGMRHTNRYTDAHELASLQRWTHGVDGVPQRDTNAHGEDNPYD